MGGKNPRSRASPGRHLHTAAGGNQGKSPAGAIGFDPTRGGEMPWGQPGLSPRDNRNSPQSASGMQGQSQVKHDRHTSLAQSKHIGHSAIESIYRLDIV